MSLKQLKKSWVLQPKRIYESLNIKYDISLTNMMSDAVPYFDLILLIFLVKILYLGILAVRVVLMTGATDRAGYAYLS